MQTLLLNLLVLVGISLVFWMIRRHYIKRSKLTPRELDERDHQVRDLIRHSYQIREQITQARTLTELAECDRELGDLLETFTGIADPETLDRHRVRLQDALDDKNARLRTKYF